LQLISHKATGYLREPDTEAAAKSAAEFIFGQWNEFIPEHLSKVVFGDPVEPDAPQGATARVIRGAADSGVDGYLPQARDFLKVLAEFKGPLPENLQAALKSRRVGEKFSVMVPDAVSARGTDHYHGFGLLEDLQEMQSKPPGPF
jgi:hypothetical protein